MGRITGTKPIFDADDIRNTSDAGIPRLMRIIFFGEGITNEGYLTRYHHYFKEQGPSNRTQKENSQKAAADRKFLLDPRKLTINMARSILEAMGFDIECISFRLRDRLTGEIKTYSTDDSIERLKEQLEQSQEVGIASIE